MKTMTRGDRTARPGTWREDVLLEMCRITVALLLLPALAQFASRVRDGLVLDALIGALLFGLLGVAALSTRVPAGYRAAMMIIVVARIAFNIVAGRGLGFNVGVLAGTAALVALLAWGRGAAALVIVAGTMMLGAAAAATVEGRLALTAEATPLQAATTLGLFLAMSGVGIAALSSVVTRLESGLRGAEFLAARLRTEARQRLARMELVVSEEEALRGRLARELHDDFGQRLTAIKIALDMAQTRRLSTPEACRESIRLLDDLASDVSRSANLRPALIDEAGLGTAIRTLVQGETQRAGITASLDLPDDVHLPADLELTCYRIVQEALTNTLRHARARSITVRGRLVSGGIAFVVRDDGIGFDVETALGLAATGERLGLLGMRERAEAVGAKVEIISSPEGTEIRFFMPLESAA